jgi:predicted nucleic acid-binding protein
VTDLVLDASVAVLALAGRTAAERALRERLALVGCHAPHLIDAEVGNVLRKLVHGGRIEAGSAEAGLLGLGVLVSERYQHQPLVRDAWLLRANLGFYDALYVALAARLRLSLLTADARLANAPRLPCAVELLS